MSEKPPEPPKAESKESAERPPVYRVIERKIDKREDGASVEEIVECNGHLHRRCLDIIWYDEKGDATAVEELLREDLGPCDGKHA